jgi:hypothetical protein
MKSINVKFLLIIITCLCTTRILEYATCFLIIKLLGTFELKRLERTASYKIPKKKHQASRQKLT